MSASQDQPGVDFKSAFCAHFKCSQKDYAEVLFYKSLDPAWRPVAWVVRSLRHGFFDQDLEFLEQLGETVTRQAFSAEANAIRFDLALNSGLLRQHLHLRISGARLLAIYEQIQQTRRAARA